MPSLTEAADTKMTSLSSPRTLFWGPGIVGFVTLGFLVLVYGVLQGGLVQDEVGGPPFFLWFLLLLCVAALVFVWRTLDNVRGVRVDDDTLHVTGLLGTKRIPKSAIIGAAVDRGAKLGGQHPIQIDLRHDMPLERVRFLRHEALSVEELGRLIGFPVTDSSNP